TTSHALVQERVRACEFDVAAFTNVGRDHLDYHATWEDYLEAKARLIDLTANAADKGVEKTAVLNRDDPSYERLARRPISRRWTYSLKTGADFYPLDLSITGSGSRFRMKTPLGETEVTLNVPAKFNIYNAMCAAAVCVAMGVPVEEIGRGLAGFEGVRGRLEPVDQGARPRLRGRHRPPGRHPSRDRDRATRRHRPPCRQGPRTFDADLARIGTVGRTRRGRGRDSRAGLARHPLPVGERDLGR